MIREHPSALKYIIVRHSILLLIILTLLTTTQVSGQDEPFDELPTENLPPVSNPMLDYNIHSTLNYADVLDDIHFIGDESYDPNPGDNLTYFWDFGDGKFSIESSPDHVYKRIGEYTVKLTVNDSQLSDTSSIKILIISQINHEPIARISISTEKDNFGNNVANVGETIYFNATESYDPEGFELTYKWDFGDGESGLGEKLTHEYKDDGTFIIILKIIDKDSLESKDLVEIVVGTGESTNNKKNDDNQYGTLSLSLMAIGAAILFVIVLVILWVYLGHARKRAISQADLSTAGTVQRSSVKPSRPPTPEFTKPKIQKRDKLLREARVERLSAHQKRVKQNILRDRMRSERTKVDEDMKKELEDMGIDL